MSKLFLQSIKFLPDEYIDDKTSVMVFGETIIATNGNLPAIVYLEKTLRWDEIPCEEVDLRDGYLESAGKHLHKVVMENESTITFTDDSNDEKFRGADDQSPN